MKANALFFIVILALFFISPNMNAQKKKATKKGVSTAKTLTTEMIEMIESAKFRGNMHGSCSPISYLKRLGKSGMIPNPKKELGLAMDSMSYMLTKIEPLKVSLQKGYMPIHTFSNTKSYTEFVKELYYSDLENFRPKDLAKEVNAYYKQLKLLSEDGFVFDKRTETKKECVFTIKSKFIADKWEGTLSNDPKKKLVTYVANISGKIQTDIKINCTCKGKSTKALKKARFIYEMPTTLVIEFSKGGNKQRFVPAKKNVSWLNLLDVSCCTQEDVSFEDPTLEISPTENISLPTQTIGAFGGVGFSQDFEETTLCVGGEYLYNITDLGNSPLFVGANVLLETTNFMDVNNTWVGVGPTAQLFSPISPSGETQVTNGIGANFIFGSNDNGVSKDNLTGFEISINTGLNVQLNKNTSVALILPVLQYQNLTFEAENGGATFEQSSTSLFVGKNNPVQLGVRFGF